ncbi:hypothetical protein GMDG_07071 [Pseudogymnoascus destructans 20631-21]|uniref:Uncharacterized protein n=1 Tax=Pseudogymnoascus destructans (strain ATCC MYA-4855 / 20631-21) TaxID=658429 RepID=L8FYQ0_PSED2|nr:hypothetical protein GMDG_07071 [Pseudogymnoascus destructans 20631-21]
MPNLYIAMYEAGTGNYEHWALCLGDGDGNVPTIFEVSGEHGTFAKSAVQDEPESRLVHKRNIGVGEVNERDIPEFLKVIDDAKILETLYDECIIDEDDEEYKRGMKKAKEKYFGPL